MKKVLIIGSSLGGLSAAIAFAQIGWNVTVIEQHNGLITRSVGILLHHRGIHGLVLLNVLDEVIKNSYCSYDGMVDYYDENSNFLKKEQCGQSYHRDHPYFISIDRQKILDILCNRTIKLGCNFYFGHTASKYTEHNGKVSVECSNGAVFGDHDLLVAADGVNSHVRQTFWKNSAPVYSGYGFYYSRHKRISKVDKKITVLLKNKRLGINPISDDEMYIWCSVAAPIKRYIEIDEQRKTLYNELQHIKGFIKPVVDQILDKDTYVHYTSVDEVITQRSWNHGRIVLLGDSAHTIQPFLSQGGGLAIEDVCILSDLISKNDDIDKILNQYAMLRIPVVEAVREVTRKAGFKYIENIENIERIRQ